MLRGLALAAALAMPVVAWLSQSGVLGPTNGAISDRYPTLLVAAGYAFGIWSLLFAGALALAWWQWRSRDKALERVRGPAALAWALTAAWMVVFSWQWFWVALAVIWLSLAALLLAHLRLTADVRVPAWLRWPLGLHAGWATLAAFLNTAQVVVAYQLLSPLRMLPWSLALWALAGALVLALNAAQRAQLAYPLAALWGLAGVVVKQWPGALEGARASAVVAALLAVALAAQTLWLRRRQAASGRAR